MAGSGDGIAKAFFIMYCLAGAGLALASLAAMWAVSVWVVGVPFWLWLVIPVGLFFAPFAGTFLLSRLP